MIMMNLMIMVDLDNHDHNHNHWKNIIWRYLIPMIAWMESWLLTWLDFKCTIPKNSNSKYPKLWLKTTNHCQIIQKISLQVYFQRVLSSKSASKAELTSYIAAFGCIIMAVPPVLIGGIAKATKWNETDYFLVHNKTLPIPKVGNYCSQLAVDIIL